MSKISDHLIDKLKQIPELPGIYKMLDARGNVIYIGKSKCLKKRVKSYFIGTPKWDKLKKLVSLIEDIEFTVTDTHLEARLLECELIKTVKPVFNSQMKKDKGYVYLKVEDYNPYHPLSVVSERCSNTYGPFRSSFSMKELTVQLKNIYPISNENKHYSFEYHLSPVKMDQSMYLQNQEVLTDLLTDDEKISCFIKELEHKMKEAATSYRYETASRYRDLISGLNMVKFGINGYKQLATKEVLLNIPTPGGIKLFYISNGTILQNKSYSVLTEPIIEQFITNSKQLLPVINHETDEKAAIDFRDILFSEILSLPEDSVRIL